MADYASAKPRSAVPMQTGTLSFATGVDLCSKCKSVYNPPTPQHRGITNTYHSASRCAQHSFSFFLDPYWRSMLFTIAIVLCSITHACTQKETRCGDLFKWNILCKTTQPVQEERQHERKDQQPSLNMWSIMCHRLWPFKTLTLDTLSISRFQGIYLVFRCDMKG